MNFEILVSCLPGLEPFLTSELASLGFEAGQGQRGFVEVLHGTPRDVEVVNRLSHIADQVFIKLFAGTLPPLDILTELLEKLELAELFSKGQKFAVRATRVGNHDFTSMDLSSAAAKGIGRAYRRAFGENIQADLKSPDVEIVCHLHGKNLSVGLNTTGKALSRRSQLPFAHYAPLNATIAYVMLISSSYPRHGQLLDPMCGGGNILFEAALLWRSLPPTAFRSEFAFLRHSYFTERRGEPFDGQSKRIMNPEIKTPKIVGADRYWGKVRGFERNMADHGFGSLVEARIGSAFTLPYVERGEFPLVVVNPPYGRRIMNASEVDELYKGFAKAAKEKGVLEIIGITPRKHPWSKAFIDSGYREEIVANVDYGGVPATIFRHSL